MEWVLYVCTAGWVMCGQIREVVYPSETACYRALDELYRRNKPDTFKYVICQPRALNKTANKRYPPKPGAYPLETPDTRSLSGCSAVKEDVSVSDADIFACIKRIS